MKTLKIIFNFIFAILVISCNENSVQPEDQYVKILLKYNYKDELNTYDNYLVKDLVLDGLKKVEFWFTTEEQQKIEKKIIETNFYSLPDTIFDNGPVEISPNFEQYLKIQINGQEKDITWEYVLEENRIQEYESIIELSEFIKRIIESKPEYKSLPPKNGGYD
ncbi:MAG: hypothetical protein IPH62_00665 [Ignavibacteriae bacterium]|nr:hypothetical protein [Ignavibacteriota bacterium]